MSFPPTTLEPSNTLQPRAVHPYSAASLNDDSSAISGTTLARALIANSFILSYDRHGRNRYRSSGNLTRQDSATLPGANDDGLVISPYWRDRRISGGEIMHRPDSGLESCIPPVPPIPANLSSTVSRVRHLSTEMPSKIPSRSQSLRIDRLSNRMSRKSEPRTSLTGVAASPSDNSTPSPTQILASSGNPRRPLPRPLSDQFILSHADSSDHSSSSLSIHSRNSPPNLTAIPSEPGPVSIRRSQRPPPLNLPPSPLTDGEGIPSLRPMPSKNRDESQPTGTSFNTTRTENTVGSPASGEDITKVLTVYRFGSPLKSRFPVHLHESPDPSTPSLSPWSGSSKSHHTDTSNSMSLPQTPTSASKHSQTGGLPCAIQNSVCLMSLYNVGLSILGIRHVFVDQNMPDQRKSGPSRPGLLLVGNGRSRSLHVPSSPYSRRSNGSRRSADDSSFAATIPHSSGISSPDILDFMFIPSASPLPSRPHPIKVVRESLDSFGSISERSSTTPEVFRQTFPETPEAFSPLFSANIGTPGVVPLPSSSVGTPGTPLSSAHTSGRLEGGTLDPTIARTTSLYTRKTPSSSNWTQMSPIPSALGTPQSPEICKAYDVRKSSRFEAQQSQAAANLLTTSSNISDKIASPPSPSPRRKSDPTGRISRDLEMLPGRVELEATTEAKKPDSQSSEDAPSRRPTQAPPEKSPNPSICNLTVTEGERWFSAPDPEDKNGDDANINSESRLSTRGSIQSDIQVPSSAPKQQPRPLDLPIVNSDSGSTSDGAVVKPFDRSYQGQGSASSTSQVGTAPETCAVPVVSADTTTPTATPPQVPSVAFIHSLKTQSSPLVNLLPSTGLASHLPIDSSLQSTANLSTTSSLAPSSRSPPVQSQSILNPTPTSSTSEAPNPSPALPSSTFVSPTQHDQSNSLDVPSFKSSLCQPCPGLAAGHPPPPYQTAILSQAIPINGESEPHTGSSPLLPSYTHIPPSRRNGRSQLAQSALPLQTQTQLCATNSAPVNEGVVRERAESVPDLRVPRSRPLGPRKPSGGQGQNKVSPLESYRLRAGSAPSLRPNLPRSEVGFGAPPTSRKLSTPSIRATSAPRFPTVPVRWRVCTLDVARWTFTSQQLQEIASRAIRASAESYSVRLLQPKTLDTEIPEELHRLGLLTTDLKTRIRATVSARWELLNVLTIHASGTRTLEHHDLERIVEELGFVTQLVDELNDELYTVTDQISQLKRLRDVHSSSALAMSLRKLNTNFLRQAIENQLLRERVDALEAERDIAWTQTEHAAQEFDDLSIQLERDINSAPSSANNSRRVSRVRKSGVRASKSGLGHSLAEKTNSRSQKRSSSISSFIQHVPPVPPIPDIQNLGSGVSQQPLHRPPFIQTVNLPEQVMPGTATSFDSSNCNLKAFVIGGLYSVTPNTETHAMAQIQQELCEMLGINLGDFSLPKSRPRSMSQSSRRSGFTPSVLVRHNSDVKPLSPRKYNQHYRGYPLSPYDVNSRLT